MKRFMVVFLLSLAACSSPGPVDPPPGGRLPCLKNDSIIPFSLGESVSKPTGRRSFETVLHEGGSYELVITDIPPYAVFGTEFYQNNSASPLKATVVRREDYNPEHRVRFEAEAGKLRLFIDHTPLYTPTCDKYTFTLAASP